MTTITARAERRAYPRMPGRRRRHPVAIEYGALHERLASELRALERFRLADADPATVLRETLDVIWNVIANATVGRPEGPSGDIDVLLARRALVACGTARLAEVIRRGVGSGAFWPACAEWAIARLPFALVAGACVPWVFGLARRPALGVSTAVRAALEVLCP